MTKREIASLFSPKVLFLGVLVLYAFTRGLGVVYFEPQNDEVIFAQYSTLMSTNWDEAQYMTLDGSIDINKGGLSGVRLVEYKQPLQFWVNSLTFDVWENPLMGVRMGSVLLGLCGLFCWYRLLATIFDPTLALITSLLIVFSNFHLVFDAVGYTEAYVYGLGMLSLYCLYQCLSASQWQKAFLWGFLASLFLFAALFSKGSALLWMVYALLFPLLFPLRPFRTIGVWLYGKAVLIVLLAKGIHYVWIDRRFAHNFDQSVQAGLTFRWQELLEFPIAIWWENGRYFLFEVLWTELPGTTIFLALIPLIASYLQRSDRIRFQKYLVLLGIYGFSCLLPIFVAKKVEIHYFGLGFYFLYALIAGGIYFGWYALKASMLRWIMPIIVFLICVPGLMAVPTLVRWGQTDLMLIRSRPGWANGAGMHELIEYLSKLPSGIVLADPQWGLPVTAMQVYESYYPQLEIKFFPMSTQLVEIAFRYAYDRGEKLYFVFDARRPGERGWLDGLLSERLFCGTRHVIQKQYQDQIFDNSSLVVCHANMPELYRGYEYLKRQKKK